MANIKVSEMATATTFEDDDYTMIIQSNKNKKITRANILGNIDDDISTIKTNIGNKNNLTTDDKTNLVNAINEVNANDNKKFKLLWEGTFTSGSITVEGANDYTFYIVWLDVGTYGVACIGTKAYGIGGTGNYGSYTSKIYSYRLAYDSNTEKFSITNVDYGGADGTQNIPIKAIYGLF